MTGSTARRAASPAPALLACALLLAAGPATADEPSPFSGYGRRGAELWAEAPRYTLPFGEAYVNERRIENGWGFGFGFMLGLTDVLSVEGRVVQSWHKVLSTDERWDLDHAFVGVRYTFSPESDAQPFVGIGGVRLSLERRVDIESSSDFRRATGYGAYVTAGVDRILSPRFVLTIRGDYYVMSYTREFVGVNEDDFSGDSRGDGAGVSVCLGYRVPTW
ncbi:MAG: outer membrane beta-barrel protein [Candidatus Eisenbacteria bacterium]|nr:outer membrane beta-barrel protein [Candidatus Eisenbacteria bacterium]